MKEPAEHLLYRMARPEALRIVQLDSFAAVYHCTSGITHLLTSPAPELLAALGEAGLTVSGLHAKLQGQYALAEEDADALAARLAELVACGLVACEPTR
ncbi:HPr-rel-A system PqqD family peptide chaperone [Sphingomonas sp. CARO-RG-8B-R24-01]|uniref:HPr-rel-A system PqqD family peptide chaperone n=1 Tax=Sphingomonas sp. CARO-RG-8B-R24-01 TaxID=2914831 RepID=UPI001F55BD65